MHVIVHGARVGAMKDTPLDRTKRIMELLHKFR